MEQLTIGTTQEVLRFDYDFQDLPIAHEIDLRNGTLSGAHQYSENTATTLFTFNNQVDSQISVSFTHLEESTFDVALQYDSGDEILVTVSPDGIDQIEHNIDDCSGIAAMTTNTAVSNLAELLHGSWRDKGVPAETIDRMSMIYGAVLAATTLPLQVEPCRTEFAVVSKLPEGVAPHNAICGMHETYDGCQNCCGTENSFASIMCAGIWWIPVGAAVCPTLAEMTLQSCEGQCLGKPPGPGEGAACHYWDCEGVCANTCDDNPIPGTCADGRICCGSPECPF